MNIRYSIRLICFCVCVFKIDGIKNQQLVVLTIDSVLFLPLCHFSLIYSPHHLSLSLDNSFCSLSLSQGNFLFQMSKF